MLQNYTDKFLLIIVCAMLSGCFSSGGMRQDVAAKNDEVAVPARVQRDYQFAIARMDANDDLAAASQFEEFLVSYPGYSAAYVNLAIIYDRQGRSDDAIAMLRSALEVKPDSVQALNRLGLISRQRGQFAEAESAWLAATLADPEYAYSWYNLGVLYDIYLQDLPSALDHYQQYQSVTGSTEQDAVVGRWITDLERRIGTPARAAQAREVQ